MEQQRTTIAALKRDGHEITDSGRHLRMSEHAAAPDQADGKAA